jgi:glycosyltransferase involved in cell wall biosynthesis
MVFCNSNYTKDAMLNLWKQHGVKDPIVVYPPVNLEKFWCDKPLAQRKKRVVYVARFIPAKRHEILKKLARDLPDIEFVSVGGLIEAEKDWFNRLQTDLPANYTLKTNLPGPDLLKILKDSRVYVHLMEGEHFGIAPIEGLASGCVTIVHNSGGMKEFIPSEYRWENYGDLKEKIVRNMEAQNIWELKRKELWSKIEVLKPETFEKNIWNNLQSLLSTE